MREFALAAVLAMALLAALAALGRLRFVIEEMPTWTRRVVALLLLWAVLVACVAYPTISPGEAADVDPATVTFAALFIGHALLAGFLLLWWLLAWRLPLRRFLRLEGASRADVRFGLAVGAGGWLLALTASAVAAGILFALGYYAGSGEQPGIQPFEIPPLLLWLIDLSVWRKLIVVAVAMTVEEAFFRAFLQTRIGWGLSSVLFALSHGGYGLPNLTASVFVVSLAIGWALRQRDNLLPCIVAHGVFDAVQLLIIMPIAVDHLHTLA